MKLKSGYFKKSIKLKKKQIDQEKEENTNY